MQMRQVVLSSAFVLGVLLAAFQVIDASAAPAAPTPMEDCGIRFLRGRVMRGEVTAMDLRAAFYLSMGSQMGMPTDGDQDRAFMIEDLAANVESLPFLGKTTATMTLVPGDILVDKPANSTQGKVYIVQSYDREHGNAAVVGYDETRATELRVEALPLPLPLAGQAARIGVRPGMFGLRMKSLNGICH